jgi:DNA mismatch endonuclease (patch repair protein)
MDRMSRSARSQLMSRIGGKNTAPELKVRKILSGLGLRFRLHAKDLPGRPDIVNRRRRLAIFVHGCFWHGHRCKRGGRPATNREFWDQKLDRNMRRDREAVRDLRRSGWKVLTVWECELKKSTNVLDRIASWLEANSGP